MNNIKMILIYIFIIIYVAFIIKVMNFQYPSKINISQYEKIYNLKHKLENENNYVNIINYIRKISSDKIINEK